MPPVVPLNRPNRSLADNCYHFLTVTLKPELYNNQIRQQHRKTYSVLCKFLESHCDKYLLVAELTKDCNIHYHIILKLSALIYEGTDLSDMHFLNDFKSLKPFGFKKLEVIKNLDNTYEYIIKDLTKTYGTLNPFNKTTLDVWKYWVKQPKPATQTTHIEIPRLDPIQIYQDTDDWEDFVIKPIKQIIHKTI